MIKKIPFVVPRIGYFVSTVIESGLRRLRVKSENVTKWNFLRRLCYVRNINGNLVQAKLPNDFTILLPKDSVISIYPIYFEKIYTKFYNIESDDVIIDVGAHVGIFTCMISSEIGNGKIVSIEPHPVNFRLLIRNLLLNNIKNVIPIKLALSDKEGKKRLYVGNSQSHSLLLRKSNNFLNVQVKTLDQLVDELKLDKIDLVKINAEGSEFDILKGAEKVPPNIRALVIAANHRPRDPHDISKFLVALRSSEFVIS